MADRQTEAYEAIRSRIAEKAKGAGNGDELLKLAEAYAWLITPDNVH